MNQVITLTTDFGLSDAYVGIMKGVILGINPAAAVVDICHGVEPQNISEAAYLIHTAYCHFPAGTVHLVVVDPGVGTERRGIILRTPEYAFVAPDNGVLSYVLHEKVDAVSISNPAFWLSPVSTTFHGRDVFAPVSAYLSLGTPLSEFGEPIQTLHACPTSRPEYDSAGGLTGHVVHIDRFGNLITDIAAPDLPGEDIMVEASGHFIRGLSLSYAGGSRLLALVGSSGHLEIAVRNGSAAQTLKSAVGDKIIVSKERVARN